ncbi:MAG: hypothetical protein J5710_05715, partial [Treponema sp.]|nr:hypothetical protein [Treponema sp.]
LVRLNEIIIQNVDSELDDNKSDLAIKRRSLTLISNKLQKKLEFTLGKDFTSEQEQSYFEQLKNQKTRLQEQITVILGKKQVLVRILQAQYQAEKIGKLHSVPKLTSELVKKILGDTDNKDSVI